MRTQPWWAALSSLLLLLTAAQSSAQSTDSSGGDPRGGQVVDEGQVRLGEDAFGASPAASIRGQSPYGAPPYGAPPYGAPYQYQRQPVDPALLWPPGTPQTFHPFPQISPYQQANIASDTHYRDNGLWFRELIFKNRQYYFSAEYLITYFREPGNALVGSTPVMTDDFGRPMGVILNSHGLGAPADMGLTQPPLPNRVDVGPGALPYVFLFDSPGDATPQATADTALFPVRSLRELDGPIDTDGIRLRWGWDSDDGSGLMLSGWWGFKAEERFKKGFDSINGIPVDQTFILANTPANGFAPLFPRNGALSLDSPISIPGTFGVGYTGSAQKFDLLYELKYETQAGGASLDFYHTPWFKRDWITFRPVVGARYLYIDESFNFRGIDSGFHYTVDAPSVGGGGGGGGGGGAGQTTGFTWRPDGSTVHQPVINGLPRDLFFEAYLNSESKSHLAGPQVGFRYDFGEGDGFRIWGQSVGAVLANHERVRVQGNNIGNPFELLFLADIDMLAEDTSFDDTESHTHASPMFEQSIFAEMDVLKYIPLVKDCHIFDDSILRIGYTYTVVGNVARPGDAVSWRGYPDFPSVSVEYKTWSTHNWSFAVERRY